MEPEESDTHKLGDETSHVTRGRGSARDENSVSSLKPIIKELVRTQVCFPDIKLLVDRISIVKVPSATESDESDGLEAYRLYLTDREKTIQAVVKRRLHKLLNTFDVREGSYVVLKEYQLARGKRLNGKGDVFYLAISDFYPIGEEERSQPSSEVEESSASAEQSSAELPDALCASIQDESDINKIGHSMPEDFPTSTHQDTYVGKDLTSSKSAMIEPKKRRRRTGSPNADSHLLSKKGTAYGPGETPLAKTARGEIRDNENLESTNVRVKDTPRLDDSIPPHGPLQLSSLASVTGTNASRNKQVNILAMIEHVSSSTVKPRTAPLKRDVRIVDPSTDKKVVLSVFMDPINFIPKKYDIILFRDLTTYDFSGGNLNAYPKKCRGKDWYLLDPYEIEECDMKSMESFREEFRKRLRRGPDDES